MCYHTIHIVCPHCSSNAVVKNGRKPTGKQNFKCRACKKQFQAEYRYRGADPAVKRLAVRMLCRNSGIRDIAATLGISTTTVLALLVSGSASLAILPRQRSYGRVQIDEVWSFVGQKQRKRWLLYAYAPETDEILAFVCGSRSRATVKKLLAALAPLDILLFCTDAWRAFQDVIPAKKHRIGKVFTKSIEGVNTCLRARNRRFVRRTTCFSKKQANHDAALRLMIAYRNRNHIF
jgi:insertion element IS1 protein InsB